MIDQIKDGVVFLFFLVFLIIAIPFIFIMILSDKIEEA